ncbi:plasmid pRiA4b ORF-3 family protein [Leptolyngbya sp. FACHB-16]|nr:plasmid pRiA4b ORF-3 family protein [Leptolyngbya sp. FACHB-8]MBD2158639.1 plasmid pRiA4b ORF-3 family protein [Leptolyngbya sp. FACHB-16]
MEEKFNSIVALTDEFARQRLNDEYAQLFRKATAALCRKRPSPLESGQAKTWAGGIAHAIGMVNFLYDSSQNPHITSADLYKWFGIGASTGQGKSKLVRDTLKMQQFDPEWCLPSRIDDNPLVWMLSVNGLIMDIRRAPLGAQVEAYRKGLIPYIPGHKEDSEAIAAQVLGISSQGSPASRKTTKTKATKKKQATSPEALQALYVIDVILIDGPVTDKFLNKNPQVIRTIEIRGDQTLADLHAIIFKAFNREEEHLYEFQLRGERPNDPNAERYGLVMDGDDDMGIPPAEDASKAQIGALGLEIEEPFGYWFDFGDDWWHQLEITAIAEPQPKVKYPRITQRIGASPPQYADF